MFLATQMKHKLYRNLGLFRLCIEKKVEEFGPQYQAFGLFGVLNYPFFYIVWKYYNDTGYESFLLRITATSLSIALLLKNYWPNILKPWLPVYWYFTLLFCLPFFFFYMLFMNGGSAIWLMSSNVVICWLLFIVDLTSCIFIVCAGILLACLIFLFSVPDFIFSVMKWWGVLFQYTFSFLLAAFFIQKKHQFNEKKLQAMQTLATTLAHEIRTPLASLNASIEGIKPYWPTFISAYEIAKTLRSDVPTISPSQINLLQRTVDRMQREVHFTNTIINMLLVNVGLGKIKNENAIDCSARDCVEQALQRYPFSDPEKALIRWEDTSDFFFKGNPILLIHVLFNLMKNALYHIKAVNKGVIDIWFVTTAKYDCLHFRDTGAGISPKLLPRIFEHFFSRTYHGSGIGLTFCKAVMESFEGIIECQSVENEYTEFVLKFPKSTKFI